MEAYTLDALIERNEAFANRYKRTALMMLINNGVMTERDVRSRLLDAIQIFFNLLPEYDDVIKFVLAVNDRHEANRADLVRRDVTPTSFRNLRTVSRQPLPAGRAPRFATTGLPFLASPGWYTLASA